MKFKIKPLKDIMYIIIIEYIIFICTPFVILIPILIEKLFVLLFIPGILYFIFFILLFLELRRLEWFEIYDDKIIARCIFGVKNTVFIRDIKNISVQTVGIIRGLYKEYYFIDDGRKDGKINFILGDVIYSYLNSSKYNLRIYKTKEIEEYIKKKLTFQRFIVYY